MVKLLKYSAMALVALILLALISTYRLRKPDVRRVENPLSHNFKETDCSKEMINGEIPKVKSSTEMESYYCWGFLHGNMRGWQSDYLRRLVQGRASEVLGTSHFKADVLFQILELEALSRRLFLDLDPFNQQKLWAYSAGMTKALSKNEGKGFTYFDYRPDEWHPIDSLSIVMLMSFAQTRKTFEQEIIESQLLDKHKENIKSVLEDDGLPWETTILKREEVKASKRDEIAQIGESFDKAYDFFEPLGRLGIGSNNWVLSPKRSKAKNAWLANDPHLNLQRPSFFFWQVLKNKDWTLFGGSLPGIPVVISGLNQDIAWGVTNSYMDVAEAAFIDENEIHQSFNEITPKVLVKTNLGFFDINLWFKSTKRVGQIRVLPVDAPAGKVMALKWSGYDIDGRAMDPIFEVPRLQRVRDAQVLFQNVEVPAWNFVFADTDGKIGYQSTGLIPKYTKPRVYGVQNMSLEDFKNTNYLRKYERPSLVEPSRGYIATANNRHWPEGSSFHGGRGYYHPFRAFRIEELINEKPKHDLKTLKRIQCDNQAVDARFLVPLIVKQVNHPFVERLKTWDFNSNLDCEVCATYRLWMEAIKKEWMQSEAGLYRWLQKGLTAEESEKWQSALSDIVEKIRNDGLIPWREYHQTNFPHVSKDETFKMDRISTPGDLYSVNPGTGIIENNYIRHDISAAHRIVVELSSPPKVWGVLVGENEEFSQKSLNSFDGNYMRWVNCELREIPIFD